MRKSNSLEGGLEDHNQAVNLFEFKFTGYWYWYLVTWCVVYWYCLVLVLLVGKSR